MTDATPVATHTTFACAKCKATLFASDGLLGETNLYYLFGAPQREGVVSVHKHYDDEGEHTSVACAACGATIGAASTQSVYNDDAMEAAQTNYRIHKSAVAKEGLISRTRVPIGMIATLLIVCVLAGGAYYYYSEKRQDAIENAIPTTIEIAGDEYSVLVRDARFVTTLTPELPQGETFGTLYVLHGSTELQGLRPEYSYLLLGPNRTVRTVYKGSDNPGPLPTDETDGYLLVVSTSALTERAIREGALLYFVTPGDLLAL